MAIERPGIAPVTDARVSAGWLAGLFRPGPRSGVDPMAAGPRPRVAPSALLTRLRPRGARAERQLAVLAGGRPAVPPPYTEADARAVSAVRKAAVGKSPPMTFRKTFVVPFRSSSATTTEAATTSGGAAKLPCVDCG